MINSQQGFLLSCPIFCLLVSDSLGEKRAQNEASSRDLCEDAATMNQVLEVALFNEFAEPMLGAK